MTLRMTLKTWDCRGVFKEDFEGDLGGDLGGDWGGDWGGGWGGDWGGHWGGDLGGDLEGNLEGDWSGLVQVWFSLQPKFNSFELDSEVGRLVLLLITFRSH